MSVQESRRRQWFSPVLKQCFVTLGVSLNMAGTGLVIGFGAPLLVQLKASDSVILIDESSGSWIASLPGCFLFVGNLLVVPIMGKFGRRTSNLISISLLITTWISIIFSSNVTLLLIARALQGTYMGMSTTLGSLLIGEYSSPRNRGALLMTISVFISLGVLAVHLAGSYLPWKQSAMVCAVIAIVDLFIVVLSPESPSWLASQGRIEESMRVFRWLRGDAEEEELKKIIETSMAIRESKVKADNSFVKNVQENWIYFKTTIRKKEFYKPIIIMLHIYTLAMWSGVNLITVYAEDFIHRTVGKIDVDIALLVFTLDVHRLVANTFAVFIIKKVRRRLVLFTTVGTNITALLALAVYTYAKDYYTLSFDHPMIGLLLAHSMMFAIATGSLAFSFIIAGEIFPLEFKNLAGGISVLSYSANLFLAIKTAPFCFSNFGVYGTCGIYALIAAYCLTVAGTLLPETKDRTLHDIEDEFRGKPLSPEKSDSKPSGV